MYEVEIKVEMTAAERDRLIEALGGLGFSHSRTTLQNDYYIHAEKSPHGGWDIKRYRDEDGTCFYTEKSWEMVDGTKARREEEREVSLEELQTQLKAFPHAGKIKKERQWFKGMYEHTPISVTIDTVKFDHSDHERFFVEAEIGITDKARVAPTKEFIRNFLKKILAVDTIVESSGMFLMLTEKK